MIRALCLLGLLLAAWQARAETLIAAMSTHRIQINSNYTGAQLTVFGLIERDGRTVARPDPYDIVITTRGPQRMLVVREKERVGPIWINRTQRRFPDNPVFLSVSTSRPLTDMLSPQAAQRDRIGLFNAQRLAEIGLEREPGMARFRDGLVRVLKDKGLYREQERGVTFLSPMLFSAPIEVPATAPTGSYEIDIVLYAGGVVLARESTNFEVVKTGFEQGLATAAHDYPLLYGLVTALFAVMLGWLATVIFRRD